jgi:hypothetical protein
MSNGMSLSEKISKYETVRRDNCKACGNPWWFDMINHFECTTCFHEEEPGGWPARDRIPIINTLTTEDTMSEDQEKATDEDKVADPEVATSKEASEAPAAEGGDDTPCEKTEAAPAEPDAVATADEAKSAE